MNNQLIPVVVRSVGSDAIATVNARELHNFLGVGKDFSNWIKDRIESFGFVENQDFVCSPILVSEGRGGHNRKDYFLSLDMAKELSMVERNEKGKQARLYFLECERRSKQVQQVPGTFAEALKLAYEQQIVIQEQTALISYIQPKAEALDRIANSDGWFSLREAAKILKITERKFIAHLQGMRWLYRDMKGKLKGYASVTPRFINHRITQIPSESDPERISLQPMVTTEGIIKLASLFNLDITEEIELCTR